MVNALRIFGYSNEYKSGLGFLHLNDSSQRHVFMDTGTRKEIAEGMTRSDDYVNSISESINGKTYF